MRREVESVDFGQWQKEQRKKHNMRQEDLAKLVNSNASAICQYEKGKMIPSIDVAENIAKVFGAEFVIREKGNEEN